MMATKKDRDEKQYGVTEVARRLNRATSRIRQICIANNIGICYGERYRMLSENDVRYIASFLRHSK